MPRKTRRKLNLNQSVNEDIPYSKVRVEWIDILSDSGWADEKGFNKMKLATPVNEGWLYSKDKNSIKLFASYDKEDDGSFSFGDRTMIPRQWIRRIQKILSINYYGTISYSDSFRGIKSECESDGQVLFGYEENYKKCQRK